jgi:ankyrin repeat protein
MFRCLPFVEQGASLLMSLRAAIIKGHLEEAKSFSSEDPLLPNESDGDLTCFHYAAHYNNSQVLAFLLTLVAAERGLFVKSRRGNTPFHSAALAGENGCFYLVQIYLMFLRFLR